MISCFWEKYLESLLLEILQNKNNLYSKMNKADKRSVI